MTLTNVTEEKGIELEWWVEIVTAFPSCTYFFGPFDSKQEAQSAQIGYLEDLKQENAKGFAIQIKQCQPRELTRFVEG